MEMYNPQIKKHFKARLKERFGIKLSRKEKRFIINRIKKGETVFLRYQPDDKRMVFGVEYKGYYWKVVFDPELDELITVMTVSRTVIDRINNKKPQKKKRQYWD